MIQDLVRFIDFTRSFCGIFSGTFQEKARKKSKSFQTDFQKTIPKTFHRQDRADHRQDHAGHREDYADHREDFADDRQVYSVSLNQTVKFSARYRQDEKPQKSQKMPDLYRPSTSSMQTIDKTKIPKTQKMIFTDNRQNKKKDFYRPSTTTSMRFRS